MDKTADKSRQYAIAAMPVVDLTRHLLYIALYHYRCGMYSAAISLLQEANVKLQHPYLMYPGDINVEKYRKTGGEHQSFTQMMKEIVAWPIELNADVTIQELALEHQAAYNYSVEKFCIPPLVFTKFAYFLCYHHMTMVQEAESALQELTILVHEYSDHIPKRDRAISWQILGICQEMKGDCKGAYQSYCNALQQRWGIIKCASFSRILVIVYKSVTGGC